MTSVENALLGVNQHFADALSDTVATMTGIFVTVEDNSADEEEYTSAYISGLMALVGEMNVLLVLSMDQDSAKMLIANMTGAEPNEVSEKELCDGIAELVNMTAGSVKAKMTDPHHTFQLTSPFTIIGEQTRMVMKKRVKKFIARYIESDVQMVLKLFYL